MDFGVRPRILLRELVAGEAKHLKAPILVLQVEVFELLKLRREAALARGVHDEKDFPFVVAERFFPFRGFAAEVIDVHAQFLFT